MEAFKRRRPEEAPHYLAHDFSVKKIYHLMQYNADRIDEIQSNIQKIPGAPGEVTNKILHGFQDAIDMYAEALQAKQGNAPQSAVDRYEKLARGYTLLALRLGNANRRVIDTTADDWRVSPVLVDGVTYKKHLLQEVAAGRMSAADDVEVAATFIGSATSVMPLNEVEQNGLRDRLWTRNIDNRTRNAGKVALVAAATIGLGSFATPAAAAPTESETPFLPDANITETTSIPAPQTETLTSDLVADQMNDRATATDLPTSTTPSTESSTAPVVEQSPVPTADALPQPAAENTSETTFEPDAEAPIQSTIPAPEIISKNAESVEPSSPASEQSDRVEMSDESESSKSSDAPAALPPEQVNTPEIDNKPIPSDVLSPEVPEVAPAPSAAPSHENTTPVEAPAANESDGDAATGFVVIEDAPAEIAASSTTSSGSSSESDVESEPTDTPETSLDSSLFVVSPDQPAESMPSAEPIPDPTPTTPAPSESEPDEVSTDVSQGAAPAGFVVVPDTETGDITTTSSEQIPEAVTSSEAIFLPPPDLTPPKPKTTFIPGEKPKEPEVKKPKIDRESRNSWFWPVPANIDVAPSYDGHGGVDFFVQEGTPITAMKDGVVIAAGIDNSMNQAVCSERTTALTAIGQPVYMNGPQYHIVIEHKDDGSGVTYTESAHLSPDGVNVKVGDKVYGGQVIGKSGGSGCSQGPHLHQGMYSAYPAPLQNIFEPVPIIGTEGY